MVARARLVVGGRIGTPAVEEWSCGLNWGPGSSALPDTAGELQTWTDSVAALIIAMSSAEAPLTWLSSIGTIETVTGYYYPGPGPAAAVAQTDISPAKAGSGVHTFPFQITQAITLNTPVAGRRTRGRIYWPRLAGTIQAPGTISTTQGTADDFRDMLESWGTDGTTSGAYALSVYSTAGDLLTPVSSISIGNVLDTQRRRRDQVVETRVTSVV